MSIVVQKTAEKKKRIPLNLKKKLELYQYKEENPDTSFENIGNPYSERWGRSVTKSMVFRSYTFIKAEKQKETTFDQSDMGRRRIASSNMI